MLPTFGPSFRNGGFPIAPPPAPATSPEADTARYVAGKLRLVPTNANRDNGDGVQHPPAEYAACGAER